MTGLADRIRTPKVARAMLSPGAIVAAAAGAAVVVATGLPLVLLPVGAAAGWVARVAVAVPRGRPSTGAPVRVNPKSLRQPWQGYVAEALQARNRFERAAATTPPGAIAERLGTIGGRIGDLVEESYRIARQGESLDDARRQLDVEAVRRELAALGYAGPPPPGSSQARTIEALQGQLASAQRIDRQRAEVDATLRLLDARLDELVARAVELSVGRAELSDESVLRMLDDDVDGLVGEMEALRSALEEFDGSRRHAVAPPLPDPAGTPGPAPPPRLPGGETPGLP